MVKGRGITTAMAAIPQPKGKNQPNKVWKVLFDSGSDGDIASIRESKKSSIDMHNRLHPQSWKTSNGIFDTSKIGNVLLTLPKFSTSKIMSVRPDIQSIDEDQPPPMHDLIIGLETLSDWKTILNFHDKTLIIDHVELPMQSLISLNNPKILNNLYR